MNNPYLEYPSNDPTNPDVLMERLGYFWTNIFKDTKTLKGLTFAQASHIVQQYYELSEVVNSIGVDTLPVYSRVKFFPILIKRSEVKVNPLVFGDGSTFGVQGSTDPLFDGLTFKFGRPKTNNDGTTIYTCPVPAAMINFAVVADRLIKPTSVLVSGVDATVKAGSLWLKQHPFEILGIKSNLLFDDEGKPAMFYDTNQRFIQDELVVLWAYEAELDNQVASQAYGWLFKLYQPSSERYSEVLRRLLKIQANGASVNNIKSVVAAFMGLKPVVNTGEVVQKIFSYTPPGVGARDVRVVQTDQNIYKADSYFNASSHVVVGAILEAGDILFDAVEYYDVLEDKTWWRTKVIPKISYNNIEYPDATKTPKMSFAPGLFAGSYDGELTFKNEMELFTCDSAGGLHFPVGGSVADVARFNHTLDQSGSVIKAAVGLNTGGSVIINPLDFLFENFLKTGSALIKINFINIDQASLFASMFKYIRDVLPKSVLFIFFMDFSIPVETLETLNSNTSITVNGNPVTSNSDGTNSNGMLAAGVANYNEDVRGRLFALSKGATSSTLAIKLNTVSFPGDDAGSFDGRMLTPIPSGKTSREVNNLLLIDFS